MKKRELLDNDRKYIWHPFTQMKDYEDRDHILIKEGKGIYLYDYDGNKYYDTIASWWVNLHGHSNPRINKAVSNQMETLEHVNFSGFTHEPGVDLAKRIVDLMPDDLTKLFYSDNGSTAVEVALKMSFQYWKNKGIKNKEKFIYFENSYHGDTLGAVSVGGVDTFHKVYQPLLFDSHRVTSPNCYHCPMGKEKSYCKLECLNNLEEVLKKDHKNISGIVLEPLIMAAGGMIFYKPEVLKKIRKLATKYNVHMIDDEVAMGFGRTGEMWAFEHANITPDFVCLSKGISAGYMALAATVMTEDIYNAFYDDNNKLKTFFHGHSYTANPLACAAGVESLKIFEEKDLINTIKEKSGYLQKRMEEFKENPNIENIRVQGLIGAMDIKQNDQSQVRGNLEKTVGNLLFEKAFDYGLMFRPLGNTIYYFLPYIITKEDIDEIINRTKKLLDEVL
ncbi:MAG: adenosylmethionine--8-amino-7-oxononanoate transaminase [Fusobacteriota bacterium]